MVATVGKDYVVGKGQVFFDHFAVGTKTPTGELYLGNTPELSTTSDQSTLDHFDSDEGLNVKDESVTTENNVTGQLVTDNISPANIALWFGADKDVSTITAATDIDETFAAKKGHYIQLGVTADHPSGARDVLNVTMTIGVTSVTAAGNFDVDLALGRVYIESDAPDIDELDALIINYDIEASVRTVLIAKGTEVRGALRFISKNPVGTQKDYFWPYVKLTANGDFALKGSEWQQIPFSFEVLKKDALTERVYIDVRTV